jgi:uncharacterized membrane protein YagU involved in acid resistance
MVACIDFFEMSEICRPKFIVRHSTRLKTPYTESRCEVFNYLCLFISLLIVYRHLLCNKKLAAA